MVQKSRSASIGLKILSRVGLLFLVSIVGLFFFPITIHDFIVNVLAYHRPNGFFGYTATDWILAWIISFSFLSGIIFNLFGKKIDYIFIFLLFLLSSYEFLTAENMTLLVYSALVVATIIGTILGFGLKLLRKRFFPGFMA